LLASDPRARLLDVREPHEAVLGAPEGAISIPATQLEARLHELDTTLHYVVACRVGAKSRWAAQRLRDAGFGEIRHLSDGLVAYGALDGGFDVF
jgi:rhodanese-related sulfurtransferase